MISRWLGIRRLGTILLCTALGAAQSVSAQEPASAPSSVSAQAAGIASKILRSFWLQAPPGRQGNKDYAKGNFEGALRHYAQAGAEARAGGKPVDPAVSFNAGNALYRMKNYAQAAEAYGEALKSSPMKTGRDSAFAARAHYNLGNTLYQKGAAADSSQTDAAIADLREALARYKKALQLRPDNREAKANLERAQSLLQKLLDRQARNPKNPKEQEPSPRAKEALARALQLTQQHRYPEAKSVLDEILRTDPTAAPFRSHLQRLDDVIRIENGQDPAPPVPADPRARQKGMAI